MRAWVVALLGLVACSGAPEPARAPRAEASASVRVRPGHAARRQQLDRAVAQAESRASKQSSWMLHAELAAALLARADLDGSYDDYARVRAELDAAFATAEAGAGPHLLRARFELRLHEVAAAERDLAEVARYADGDPHSDAVRRGLLADVALGAGRWSEATAAIHALVDQERSPANLARLAHLAWKTGDDAGADTLYAEAIVGADDGMTQAWLELQRGLVDLDHRRLDDAAAHYEAADAMFPGWWLVHEHLAEVDALRGNTEAAIARYRDVVAQTRDPELIDALAELLEPGDPAEAARLHADARTRFEQRLAIFPAATYGHALEHFLSASDGATRALELARANHAARPGPEADVLLAKALLANGDPDAALAQLREPLASPWRSEDLAETAALAVKLGARR